MEIWKEIKGYEGKYEVSNLGNVKSLQRSILRANNNKPYVFKEKILKPRYLDSGYALIRLSGDNSEWKDYYLHRLVANAFIPNTEQKKQVNHIDTEKSNNKSTNLEWCTRQENIDHASKNGLLSKKRKRLTKEEVIDIRLLCQSNEQSKKEIAKYYGISYITLYNIVNYNTWKNI